MEAFTNCLPNKGIPIIHRYFIKHWVTFHMGLWYLRWYKFVNQRLIAYTLNNLSMSSPCIELNVDIDVGKHSDLTMFKWLMIFVWLQYVQLLYQKSGNCMHICNSRTIIQSVEDNSLLVHCPDRRQTRIHQYNFPTFVLHQLVRKEC